MHKLHVQRGVKQKITFRHQEVQHRGCQEGEAACENEWGGKAGHVSSVSAQQRPHDPSQRQEALRDAHGCAKEFAVREEAARTA